LLREEILETEKVIQSVTGQNTKLFRPPGGDYNDNQTVQALKEILPELKKRGYHFITVSDLLQIKQSERGKEKDQR